MTRLSGIQVITAALAVLLGAASLSAVQSSSAANQQAADIREIHDYQLTVDRLSRYESAAKAVNKILDENPAAQQKLNADSQNNTGPNTIAQSAAAIDKQSQLVAAIKSEGFSTHEYVVITYVLMVSESYVAMKKDNPSTPMPADVSPANAAFAKANYDRIKALAQATAGASN